MPLGQEKEGKRRDRLMGRIVNCPALAEGAPHVQAPPQLAHESLAERSVPTPESIFFTEKQHKPTSWAYLHLN